MKKCLLFIAVLVLSQWNTLCAQTLFNAPDTVCINQPVTLTSNVFNQTSYYWGFCSGYLMNAPLNTSIGDTFSFKLPANIKIAYDNGNYYGFVVNSASTELLRLNFGNNLDNVPSVTNFGNITNGLPVNPTSLFIVQDTSTKYWYVFVSGGWTQATSSIGRVDFGASLNNPTPNVANFGNYHNLLDGPKGIFVAQNASGNWFGYVVNHNNSQLIRLDFLGSDVSITPVPSGTGNAFGSLSTPTDMAGIYSGGEWYLFVTNEETSTVSQIVVGTDLDTVSPYGTILGNFDFRINAPSGISLNADCGNTYAYVIDSTTNQLVAIQMPTVGTPSTYTSTDYSTLPGMNFPAGISNILRDNDDLYGFIVNAADSSLTRMDFYPCHNTTFPSFSEVAPPIYSYDSPGVYNVYYVINQGLPTMQVECKTITVLAHPPIFFSDDTLVCIGDTVHLFAISSQADSIKWTSSYAIDTNDVFQDSVRVYPSYTTIYPVVLSYPDGCIVDTSVTVSVSQVQADAGPDRWILDGASTILGGPNSSLSDTFLNTSDSFYWTPYQYLSDSLSPNPSANPPYDFTYYLTVVELNDGLRCTASDTVVVHVNCGDFYLPNAFDPTSQNSAINEFGIINNQIATLSYFRIYNRWGQLVFQTSDPTQRWDGVYNGKPAPPDVYVWIADGFCTSGLEIKKSGNVTLMR